MGVHPDGTYTLWGYQLLTKDINWKGDQPGTTRPTYFFSRETTPLKEGVRKCGIPAGYYVMRNARTGLPVLTKDKTKAIPGTPGGPALP